MNVAIIVVATGPYIKFFRKLYASIEKYFLPGVQKTVILFTDSKEEWGPRVQIVPALQLPWPLPSLLRFDRFAQLNLSSYDYVYYLDADQEIVSEIGQEIFTVKGQLVGVVHPFSPNQNSWLFETDSKSEAYCNPMLVSTYYHASFFGGHTEDFVSMAKVCARNIAKDLSHLFIARWFDESHLNKYFAIHPPKALPSTYSYPSYALVDNPEKKIIHYAKDTDSMRAYMTTDSPATQGVCLLAAGAPCYGEYAYNLTASMLRADASTKVALFATPSAIASLTTEQRKIFDRILDIPPNTLHLDGKVYYNRFKLFLPEVSPYEHSMYFDVDSLWMSQMSVEQLFAYIKTFSPGIAGQCEAVVPVEEDAVIFKGIKDLKPLQAFHPALTFKGPFFYQLHGQFLYCDKRSSTKEVFKMAQRLFDAMARNELTCTMYWVWHGQPIEELCLTLATAMIGIILPEKMAALAPVSVQSEGLRSFDPFSTTRFAMSINGYATHEEAGKCGGYCMGEKETALYIAHYNKKIEELVAAGYAAVPYRPKVVQL